MMFAISKTPRVSRIDVSLKFQLCGGVNRTAQLSRALLNFLPLSNTIIRFTFDSTQSLQSRLIFFNFLKYKYFWNSHPCSTVYCESDRIQC